MSTSLRLTAFAAGAIVVFLLAFGVGRAAGPWSPDPGSDPSHAPASPPGSTHDATEHPDEH